MTYHILQKREPRFHPLKSAQLDQIDRFKSQNILPESTVDFFFISINIHIPWKGGHKRGVVKQDITTACGHVDVNAHQGIKHVPHVNQDPDSVSYVGGPKTPNICHHAIISCRVFILVNTHALVEVPIVVGA